MDRAQITFDALTRHWGVKAGRIRPADRTTLRSFLRRFSLFAVSLADQVSRWQKEQGGMAFIEITCFASATTPVFQTAV